MSPRDDASASPADDGDMLKVYVYGMLALAAVGGGLIWWGRGEIEAARRTVGNAKAKLPEMAQHQREIEAMLAVFERNKEDEAKTAPITWFTSIWQRKGVQKDQILPGEWKQADGPDGSCWEDRFTLKFSDKQPMTRAQIGNFLHEVERSSTRMRVLEMSIQRSGKKENIEQDIWQGNCMVGYRRPKLKE